ncbi:MAG: NAD(P)H-dependent oxidoreductase subunit E, partial [Planctomycetales bacterium]|nr:NAD(P)H-dependent oxidoreductase subunit E [Planctomycetales bacterium]
MNSPSYSKYYLVGVGILGVLLIGCLGALLFDHLRWRASYPVEREALREAEAAAQQDASSAERLENLVQRQTLESLRLKGRERLFGVVALLATGGLVVLLKRPTPAKPGLPNTLAGCMPRRSGQLVDVEGDPPPAATPASVPRVDLHPVQEIVRRVGHEPHRLIPLLHAVQAEYRYLPATAMEELCRLTGIAPVQAAGVASFYTRFRTKPCGKHLVQVCRGAACHVAGADRVVEELRRGLGIPPDQDTDAQGQATIETVGCMGCCHLAPAVQQDEQLLAHVRVEDLPEIIAHCLEEKPKRRGGYQPFKKSATRCSQDATAAELLTSSEEVAQRIVTGGWSGSGGASLQDYEAQGGFAALAKCLSQMTPEQIIDEVEQSGLRGRGGGGFPSAKKWRLVSQQQGEKYVIANGDEGDPG